MGKKNRNVEGDYENVRMGSEKHKEVTERHGYEDDEH